MVVGGGLRKEDRLGALREPLHHGVDRFPEGIGGFILRRIEEVHRAERIFGRELLEHRHHRRDADAGGNENERMIVLHVVDDEGSRRSRELDLIADLERIDELVGNDAGRGAFLRADGLYGNAEHAGALCLRERVMARLQYPETGNVDAQRHVLASPVGGNISAVGRKEVEGDDSRAFLNPVDAVEGAPSAPAAFHLSLFLIDAGFGRNEDVGELLVGGRPGGDQLRGCRIAEHFLGSGEKALPDDLVVLGFHAERGMALRNDPDCAVEILKGIDVCRVESEGARERLLLGAGSLMRKIEDVAELRVFSQHAAVHELRNLKTMRPDDRFRGFDKGDLRGCKHRQLLANIGSSPEGVRSRRSDKSLHLDLIIHLKNI